jgi:hypothetical protein
MQNRYVGDVGDFAKYALLRRLVGRAGEQPVRVGVVWCLYPDENHNGDGRHISYLRQLEFEGLDAIAEEEILPRGTVFCDAVTRLPDAKSSTRESRLQHRASWVEDCFRLTRASEIVFFDPDNGIEVASVPKRDPKAGKYIYWDELEPFWRRGQALLIYHHLNRTKPAAEQVAELGARLRSRFVGALVKPLVFRRGSCRVFWLVCPLTPLGREIERRANAFLSDGWTAHFRPFE